MHDDPDDPPEHQRGADPTALPEMLELDEITAEGVDAMRVPAELVEHELRRKPLRRRIIEIVVSLTAVVAIFAFAIPAITGSKYSDIWDQISRLTGIQLLELTLLWFATMVVYTGVLTSSLPGLRHTQALVMNFAGSAVSNVVPFGGAVGVAATYAMSMSWGFPAPAVTLSILVSGVWNVFTKLALPILALVVVLAMGEASQGLVVPAAIGLALLVVAVVSFLLILESERLAERVGELAERIGSVGTRILRRGPVTGWKSAVLDFRHQSIGLIRSRWRSLTIWMLLYQVGHFLLLLLCVRFMGADTRQLGWVEVLAAFAFGNLLTAIPITPSGVGFVEAGTAAILIAFGGADAGSAAAVLLYRGFTYLAEIPVGALAWGVWAGKVSWRRSIAETATT